MYPIYPMKMKPALIESHGEAGSTTRLKSVYHKETDLERVAESWEIGSGPGRRSLVANGPLAGETLAGALLAHPDWMGTRCEGLRALPISLRLIDTRDGLPPQPAPDDPSPPGDRLWYILEAAPGAELLIGEARLPASAGEGHCIPAGQSCACGGELLIAEVAALSPPENPSAEPGAPPAPEDSIQSQEGCTIRPLTTWSSFAAAKIEIVQGTAFDCDAESFHVFLVLGGELTLRAEQGDLLLRAGECAFLPAGMGVCAVEGSGEVLLVQV